MGSLLILATAWCYATIAISTRSLQRMYFATMQFYYSVLAPPATAVLIAVLAKIKNEPISMFNYNATQFGWLLLISGINFAQFCCQTIALQNERSGLVTMLGYIGLVYAFIGDIVIFNQTFGWLEITGILVIVILNIALLYTNWRKAG